MNNNNLDKIFGKNSIDNNKLSDFNSFMNFLGHNTFGTCDLSEDLKNRFEFLTSSLRKLKPTESISLEDAKQFSIESITNGITKLPENLPQVYELEKGVPFNFIARVDTSDKGNYDIDKMFEQANSRKYLSYSLITEKNISHYKTKHPFMLIYDIPPEAIVHVFPTDSDTNIYAEEDRCVCSQPSIWLSLNELRDFTDDIGMYNQITCRTKHDGNIILPKALLVFNDVNADVVEASLKLGLPVVVAHPEKDAINYVGDSIFVNANKETAYKYHNMIFVFKRRLKDCFKNKNSQKILDRFIDSFMPEEMEFIIKSTFGK